MSVHRPIKSLLALALVLAAVAVLVATQIGGSRAAGATTGSATHANLSAETGATLDHSGRNAADPLAGYPDAPLPSAITPQPSVSYYLDAPRP